MAKTKSLQEVLTEQVIAENEAYGVSDEQAYAEIKLLSNYIGNTFLGKRFNITWPEGEPPVLSLVLTRLKHYYKDRLDAVGA